MLSGRHLGRTRTGSRRNSGAPSAGGVQAIAFHPTAPRTSYVALGYYGDSTLVGTTNDGRTWTELGLDPELKIDSLAADPSTPGRLLVGTHWDGVFESRDGGTTWETLYDGQLGGRGLYGVYVDPCDTDRICLGARDTVEIAAAPCTLYVTTGLGTPDGELLPRLTLAMNPLFAAELRDGLNQALQAYAAAHAEDESGQPAAGSGGFRARRLAARGSRLVVSPPGLR